MVGQYRRLPHVYPQDKALFVTFHLFGSLPRQRYPPPGKLNSGQAFVWIDRYLDTTREGPMFLAQDHIAELVDSAIHYCWHHLNYYALHAYVIMANHVHLLITPQITASRLLQTLKGYTAREANRLLQRRGPFWQAESYDRKCCSFGFAIFV
jgi:hypothetical protein